jgi:hypothetical protein
MNPAYRKPRPVDTSLRKCVLIAVLSYTIAFGLIGGSIGYREGGLMRGLLGGAIGASIGLPLGIAMGFWFWLKIRTSCTPLLRRSPSAAPSCSGGSEWRT